MNVKIQSLVKIIGSPFVENKKQKNQDFSRDLYCLAYSNKIPLTYLNTLPKDVRGKIPEYNYHQIRLQRRLKIIEDISKLLEKKSIDYVFFKTPKSFEEYAADIDVLNLGSISEYRRMIITLSENGYYLLEKGPLATTLCNQREEPRLSNPPSFAQMTVFPKRRMGVMIDVHDQIGLSHLVYVDKRKIQDRIMIRNIEGNSIRVFAPEAELIVNTAHSVIKERQYLLKDYYRVLQCFNEMQQKEIEEFVILAKKNYLKSAVQCYLQITLFLHEMVHGTKPKKIKEALSLLGGRSWQREIRRLTNDGYHFPCKYSWWIWIKSIMEKLNETSFRQSLYRQFFHSPRMILNPRFLEGLLNFFEAGKVN